MAWRPSAPKWRLFVSLRVERFQGTFPSVVAERQRRFVVLANPHIRLRDLAAVVAEQHKRTYPQLPPLPPVQRFRVAPTTFTGTTTSTAYDDHYYDLDMGWQLDEVLQDGQEMVAVCPAPLLAANLSLAENGAALKPRKVEPKV